ncbi:MAG: GGDEF domain-containing protein [Mariprofundus sp.]|nr:GGDEF domain-containing protein [Mariprofundus sp.]
MLEMFLDEDLVDVVAVADTDPNAPGLALAREHGVKIYHNVEQALRESSPCVAFNMTGNEMLESVTAEALGSGGVIGGLEARLIWRMVMNLKNAKDELQFQASHDALTGLYNRRHLVEHLHLGVAQAVRYHHAYTVVMFDLDHFKQVNDVHGHAAGDLVLAKMSDILQQGMREGDIAGRWGGEEFLVLLAHTDRDGARQAAEQWLKNIANVSIQLDSGASISITFSAGVASLANTSNQSDIKPLAESLLHVADERMYVAKSLGRNQVCTQA